MFLRHSSTHASSLPSLVLVLVEAVLLDRNGLTLSPCTVITASYTKGTHNSVIDITADTSTVPELCMYKKQLIL